MPLHKDDQHLFRALHIPLTDDQAEFDGQILAITKVIIEYLNEKELEKMIKILPENARSLTKLEIFLNENNFNNYQDGISLLRNLWELRSSGIGHRKGSNYQKAVRKFGGDNKKLPLVFEGILKEIIEFLIILEEQVI